MTKTRNKLDALGLVRVGARFIYRTAELLGKRCRKPYCEGQVLTVVGFEPRYKNNVELHDVSGTRLLMPLDIVEKALQSKQILM